MRPEKKRRSQARKNFKSFRPNPIFGKLPDAELARIAAEVAMVGVLKTHNASASEIMLLSTLVPPALGILRSGGSIELPVPSNASDPAQAASPEGKE